MTKKDYELIAGAFEHEIFGWRYAEIDKEQYKREIDAIHCTAIEMAERLQKVNPRFNKDKFIKACGF